MKYCTCPHCDIDFEFTGASKDNLGWHTGCPDCGGSFDIDIKDFLVSEGTMVKFDGNTTGLVWKVNDAYATEFAEIVYLVSYYVGVKPHIARLRRSQFELADDWRLLKRTKYGIERVCHYPKNQEWGNVPCYNCVDRVKCNHDIFERLAQYEGTGLTPDVVAEYKKFEDELVASGLTFGAVLKLIEEQKKGDSR